MKTKKKNLRKKIILLVTAIALTITIALGGLFIPSSNQTAVQIAQANTLPTGASLFMANGNIHVGQAQNILYAIRNRQSIDRETEFRLFPLVHDRGEAVANLSRLSFRIMSVTNDRITFWASSAYRNSVYNSTLYDPETGAPSTWNDGGVPPLYSESELRTNLLADFTALSSAVPHLTSHVMTQNTNIHGARPSDRIWIPSSQEMGINGWRLTAEDISFEGGEFGSSIWARNISSTFPQQVVVYVEAGTLTSGGAQLSRGVRPALHISLESLINAVEGQDNNGSDNNSNNNEGFEIGVWPIVVGSVAGIVLIVGIITLLSWIFGSKRRR
ncbi:MAG: hypothetical protein FWE03_07320 [Firmicutes bacterium]|nr:hypothetical protein [Bacillota bacterium]